MFVTFSFEIKPKHIYTLNLGHKIAVAPDSELSIQTSRNCDFSEYKLHSFVLILVFEGDILTSI